MQKVIILVGILEVTEERNLDWSSRLNENCKYLDYVMQIANIYVILLYNWYICSKYQINLLVGNKGEMYMLIQWCLVMSQRTLEQGHRFEIFIFLFSF